MPSTEYALNMSPNNVPFASLLSAEENGEENNRLRRTY